MSQINGFMQTIETLTILLFSILVFSQAVRVIKGESLRNPLNQIRANNKK